MNQRIHNDQLARLLHSQLYDRLTAFCEQHTPEIPAEPVVMSWLNRLFNGDQSLHIFVTLDSNYKITGHMVVDVQDAYGRKIVWCHQAQSDKGNTGILNEGLEYIDKLVEAVGADCSVFSVTKGIKGLEKKFGYRATRTVMIKCAERADT
jgi:hypothetical protein